MGRWLLLTNDRWRELETGMKATQNGGCKSFSWLNWGTSVDTNMVELFVPYLVFNQHLSHRDIDICYGLDNFIFFYLFPSPKSIVPEWVLNYTNEYPVVKDESRVLQLVKTKAKCQNISCSLIFKDMINVFVCMGMHQIFKTFMPTDITISL